MPRHKPEHLPDPEWDVTPALIEDLTFIYGPELRQVTVIGISSAHQGYYWCKDVNEPHTLNLHFGEDLHLLTPGEVT